MTPLLLCFPCRGGEVFDVFAATSKSGMPRVSVELLAEQRDFETKSADDKLRVTCIGCENTKARYVVCRRAGKYSDQLYLRRYPGSGPSHKRECFSYSGELPAPLERERSTVARPGGDFGALRRELGDPEFRTVYMRRHTRDVAGGDHRSNTVSPSTVGLRRLARELLQQAGICEWRPCFGATRTERVFNGLVKRALRNAAADPTSFPGTLLEQLPADFVPWSFLNNRLLKTPPDMARCVGFGFLERIGSPRERGGRPIELSNLPELPIVIPRQICEREDRNPNSPLHSYLAHPTWVIFVAALHSAEWKVHSLAAFRTTNTGLMPVDSGPENSMVEHLIAKRRTFRRLLTPPSDFGLRKWVPDFQLLDTMNHEFLEVAGLLDDPGYADNIEEKKISLGERLLVWDTRTSIDRFNLPQIAATRPA